MENEKAIQKIICLKCGDRLEFIRELKDTFNSDFYKSQYKCFKCNYSIKITTHEWRD